MAEPRRPVEVETPFGLNKQAKRKFGFITIAVIVVLVGVFFLKKNRRTEDPTRNLQAKAKAQTDQKGGETQISKLAENQGMDLLQGSTDTDADFVAAMKRAREKEDQQKRAQQQAQASVPQQPGQRGVPASVAANGTVNGASGGAAVPTVPGVRGEPVNKIQYDSAHWMKSADGTSFVRPAYQTRGHYPVDGGKGHEALESLYLKSFAAPTTVGTTNPQFLAALKDRYSVVGPMGPRRGYGRAVVPVIKQPTNPQPDGWGGWVQVDPVVTNNGGE